MIYYLTYESLPAYVKIGYSRDKETLDKRIQTYGTYNPEPVQLLKTTEGDYEQEQRLHRIFANYRAPCGEWFYFTPQIREHIEGCKELNVKDDKDTKTKVLYLQRRKEGHTYKFVRKIPENLRPFRTSASKVARITKCGCFWDEFLSKDFDNAITLLSPLAEATDQWISKHRKLLGNLREQIV